MAAPLRIQFNHDRHIEFRVILLHVPCPAFWPNFSTTDLIVVSSVTRVARNSAPTPRPARCTVPRRTIEVVKNYEKYQICCESEPWRYPRP